jgi:hypothetical protein
MWHASSTGPDETDLQAAMRAVGILHSGAVTVIITPIGGSPSGGMLITVALSLTVLPGSSLPSLVTIESRWPCVDCRGLTQHLWAQMIALDYAAEQKWNTLPLPEG